MPETAATTVTLSLVSHTNAGKTTLARTLLRRDIGDVRDEPHVTDISEAHPMITTAAGHVLQLWDTPGFGDSARLRNRLRQRTGRNALGWFLGEVWDRWTNRPQWCSQQALRNVHDEADLVLYLVNAAESPDAAGYLEPELEILTWVGKPIVVLLNQTARQPDAAAAETRAWRERLAAFPLVADLIPLDAFSRCWVQEDALLARIAELVPAPKRPAARVLAAAWHERNRTTFDDAMNVLARHLARTARDRAPLGEQPTLRRWLNPLLGRADDQARLAGQALVERLAADNRQTLLDLLQLHGLEPGEARAVEDRLQAAFVEHRGLNETDSSILAGLVSGALSGLTADFLAGGLTFGGGAVAGALLGASGARLAAKGWNALRDKSGDGLRWPDERLEAFARVALLRYLAVAHHGRGRGRFDESTDAAAWTDALDAAFTPRREELQRALARAAAESDELRDLLQVITADTLARLYPDVPPPAPFSRHV